MANSPEFVAYSRLEGQRSSGTELPRCFIVEDDDNASFAIHAEGFQHFVEPKKHPASWKQRAVHSATVGAITAVCSALVLICLKNIALVNKNRSRRKAQQKTGMPLKSVRESSSSDDSSVDLIPTRPHREKDEESLASTSTPSLTPRNKPSSPRATATHPEHSLVDAAVDLEVKTILSSQKASVAQPEPLVPQSIDSPHTHNPMEGIAANPINSVHADNISQMHMNHMDPSSSTHMHQYAAAFSTGYPGYMQYMPHRNAQMAAAQLAASSYGGMMYPMNMAHSGSPASAPFGMLLADSSMPYNSAQLPAMSRDVTPPTYDYPTPPVATMPAAELRQYQPEPEITPAMEQPGDHHQPPSSPSALGSLDSFIARKLEASIDALRQDLLRGTPADDEVQMPDDPPTEQLFPFAWSPNLPLAPIPAPPINIHYTPTPLSSPLPSPPSTTKLSMPQQPSTSPPTTDQLPSPPSPASSTPPRTPPTPQQPTQLNTIPPTAPSSQLTTLLNTTPSSPPLTSTQPPIQSINSLPNLRYDSPAASDLPRFGSGFGHAAATSPPDTRSAIASLAQEVAALRIKLQQKQNNSNSSSSMPSSPSTHALAVQPSPPSFPLATSSLQAQMQQAAYWANAATSSSAPATPRYSLSSSTPLAPTSSARSLASSASQGSLLPLVPPAPTAPQASVSTPPHTPTSTATPLMPETHTASSPAAPRPPLAPTRSQSPPRSTSAASETSTYAALPPTSPSRAPESPRGSVFLSPSKAATASPPQDATADTADRSVRQVEQTATDMTGEISFSDKQQRRSRVSSRRPSGKLEAQSFSMLPLENPEVLLEEKLPLDSPRTFEEKLQNDAESLHERMRGQSLRNFDLAVPADDSQEPGAAEATSSGFLPSLLLPRATSGGSDHNATSPHASGLLPSPPASGSLRDYYPQLPRASSSQSASRRPSSSQVPASSSTTSQPVVRQKSPFRQLINLVKKVSQDKDETVSQRTPPRRTSSNNNRNNTQQPSWTLPPAALQQIHPALGGSGSYAAAAGTWPNLMVPTAAVPGMPLQHAATTPITGMQGAGHQLGGVKSLDVGELQKMSFMELQELQSMLSALAASKARPII